MVIYMYYELLISPNCVSSGLYKMTENENNCIILLLLHHGMGNIINTLLCIVALSSVRVIP